MTTAPAAFDCAVLASRCQPVHAGHCAALEQARALAPRVVVLILGADAAPSPRTPWSTTERVAQVTAVSSGSPVEVRSVRDVPYDTTRWRAAIERAAGASGRVALLCDADLGAARPADWTLVAPAAPLEPDAALLREALLWGAQGIDRATLEARLTPDQARALATFAAGAVCAALREEAAFVREFRARWAVAPYPPVFVTVDALVTWRDELLLIRRARAPGRGLWALPGGFLDQHETLLAGARREAGEESGLTPPAAALRATRVFDAPQRSLRGRTVTHVFHFELAAHTPRPAVGGGDDADRAAWVARATVDPARLFEDHHAILQVMLGLD